MGRLTEQIQQKIHSELLPWAPFLEARLKTESLLSVDKRYTKDKAMGLDIYPDEPNIFSAFAICPPGKSKGRYYRARPLSRARGSAWPGLFHQKRQTGPALAPEYQNRASSRFGEIPGPDRIRLNSLGKTRRFSLKRGPHRKGPHPGLPHRHRLGRLHHGRYKISSAGGQRPCRVYSMGPQSKRRRS